MRTEGCRRPIDQRSVVQGSCENSNRAEKQEGVADDAQRCCNRGAASNALAFNCALLPASFLHCQWHQCFDRRSLAVNFSWRLALIHRCCVTKRQSDELGPSQPSTLVSLHSKFYILQRCIDYNTHRTRENGGASRIIKMNSNDDVDIRTQAACKSSRAYAVYVERASECERSQTKLNGHLDMRTSWGVCTAFISKAASVNSIVHCVASI
jgi:hypothetical protein